MTVAVPIAELRAPRKSTPTLRVIFSFPVMLACLLAALAVFTARSRFDDPDMWWHMRTGQIVWSTHAIPTADLYSYTTHHHAWVPQEWLSQTLIYAAYRLDGYTGLMLWLCLFAIVLLIAGYFLCALYSGNAKVSFVGALMIWFFATVGVAIRPQMVGYSLLVIELLVLHLGRTQSPRWFFALPPLFALWVNCHGSFFFGLIVAGALLVCSFFDFRIGLLTASRWDRKRKQNLLLSFLLSVGALFLNPDGIRQISYPLNTMLRQPISLARVEEWQPLAMNTARGIGLFAVLACIFLLVVMRRSELRWDEFVLLGLGTWLAMQHNRMVFVFGILAAPVVSRLLADTWENYEPEHDHPLPNAVLIAASLLAAFLAFPSPRSLAAQVEAGSPVKAVEFIQSHHLTGNMLNDYVYGGYLIWAAPEYPVFIDGRGDVFEWTGVIADFGNWATLQSDPTTLLKKYNIGFCLLSRGSPMARVMPLLPGWGMIYSDHASVIFARNATSGIPETGPG